jgi:hypothetical protein
MKLGSGGLGSIGTTSYGARSDRYSPHSAPSRLAQAVLYWEVPGFSDTYRIMSG